MIKLDLETKNEAEKRIKDYLENNVSETLAEKINNGIHITKDEKILINKKTLSGFMKYANDEARKLAEKGANFACIEDTTVFGWAIHYFEEESIEGKLYNEDGTEYKAAVVKKPDPVVTQNVTKAKPKSDQLSLFDFSDEPIIETTVEDTSLCINTYTGEVIEEKPSCETDDLVKIIREILGDDLEVRL